MKDTKFSRKEVAIINYVCSAVWYICSIFYFCYGNKILGILDLVLGNIWLVIATANLRQAKKQTEDEKIVQEN